MRRRSERRMGAFYQKQSKQLIKQATYYARLNPTDQIQTLQTQPARTCVRTLGAGVNAHQQAVEEMSGRELFVRRFKASL